MIKKTHKTSIKIGLYPIEERLLVEKEFFSGGYSTHNLNQNLSHSAGILAACQYYSGNVGIDLEISPAPANFICVAKEFFWAEEVAFLERFHGIEQAGFFLALWTAKEAHCKLLRSNLGDILPGPNFIKWLTDGCKCYFEYVYNNRKAVLVFKTGNIGEETFYLSISI